MAVRADPTDLVTPSVARMFETTVSNPLFWPWLAQHAATVAGEHKPGTPGHAWIRRAQALANDLPALRGDQP